MKKGEIFKKEEHIERHKELHNKLDELVADFIGVTNNLPSKTTLMDFMAWSYEQTIHPEDSMGIDGETK